MTSRTSRPTTTILVLVPLVAVPLLAVFGIPQFAPVAASQSYEGDEFDFAAEFPLGSEFSIEAEVSNRRSADDLFAPFPDSHHGAVESSSAPSSIQETSGQPRERWEDLFREPGGANDFEFGHSPDPRFSRDGLPASNTLPRRESQQVADASATLQPALARQDIRGESRHPATARNSNPGRPRPPQSQFTWQDAVRRLKELSINHYRLEPGLTENEFVFRCRFTPEDNPRVTYLLEAEAAEPLRAVQKVLAEIDELLESRRTTAVLVR